MKTKKVTGQRVEFKRNKQGVINYRCVGKTGKILADIRQGFERKAGMTKNITALTKFFATLDPSKIVEVK